MIADYLLNKIPHFVPKYAQVLASLWCSLLTMSSNNLIDNDSRLSESVGIPALFNASQYDKLGKIIHMARL